MNNYYGSNWDVEQVRRNPILLARTNAYLQRVFWIMTAGLAITGFTAYGFAGYLAANPNVALQIFSGPMMWVLFLAPFAFILALSFGIERMSYSTATLVFGAYSLVMGLSLSSIFFVYSTASIAATFFITAGMFAAMAIYGATTKRDLTRIGTYLVMALFGIIIASLVNIFLQLSTLSFIISIVGVVVFCGLTAYNMQQQIAISQMEDGSEWYKKASLMGALSLYLNFINLFLMLLRLFGSSRE